MAPTDTTRTIHASAMAKDAVQCTLKWSMVVARIVRTIALPVYWMAMLAGWLVVVRFCRNVPAVILNIDRTAQEMPTAEMFTINRLFATTNVNPSIPKSNPTHWTPLVLSFPTTAVSIGCIPNIMVKRAGDT